MKNDSIISGSDIALNIMKLEPFSHHFHPLPLTEDSAGVIECDARLIPSMQCGMLEGWELFVLQL